MGGESAKEIDVIESDVSGEGRRVEKRWRVEMEGDAIIGGANVWAEI